MSEQFQGQSSGITGPFVGGATVTPNDATDLARGARALWIGVAGDIRVTTEDGSTVTFTGFGPGWMPGRIIRVHATGTTASGIVGVW